MENTANYRKRLATLDDVLRSGTSATAVLEKWCGALVTAQAVEAGPAVSPQQLATADALFRRVQLAARGIAVADATNWYRADLLTDEMNEALEKTSAPFGRVVGTLNARRETLSAQKLWDGFGMMPMHVLEYRAVLFTATGQAFCEVHELYRSELLTTF